MKVPLKVLLVEDSEEDAILTLRQLLMGGCDPTYEQVDTPEGMRSALSRQKWDLVISDYMMPGFGGLQALEVLKESGLDLPFIIVSGKIGEDVAVHAMKAGAHDYIIKGNLKRLVPAIERELRDAETRHQRRMADEALKKAYEELEAKVRERTSELQTANDALKEEIELRGILEKEREQYVKELQHALTEVKTLSGLLPICASCKKIRDDKGYWNQIEVYIRDHSDAKFTHGLCPDCAVKLYPDFFEENPQDSQ